jgi:O-methyltransferase
MSVLDIVCFLNQIIDDRFLDSGLKKRYFLRPLPEDQKMYFIRTSDPVRYGAIGLAIKRICTENIEGSFAEVGAYQGKASAFIHKLVPDRSFYVFDTFEGFPTQDLDEDAKEDDRFKDTSLDIFIRNVGDLQNVHIKKGIFPDTTVGLEAERFAFVLFDLDLFPPTIAGLSFFYPRMTPGGYLVLHDYNSPESEWAVSRATESFFKDKPEKVTEIPDAYGSVIVRKM